MDELRKHLPHCERAIKKIELLKDYNIVCDDNDPEITGQFTEIIKFYQGKKNEKIQNLFNMVNDNLDKLSNNK